MTNDPTTGLPTLPAGYFWRITSDKNSSLFWIELRQHRRFVGLRLGSKFIALTHVYDGTKVNWKTEPFNVEMARVSAQRLLDERAATEEIEREQAEIRKLNKQFMGDYPPKKLED